MSGLKPFIGSKFLFIQYVMTLYPQFDNLLNYSLYSTMYFCGNQIIFKYFVEFLIRVLASSYVE